MYLQHATDKEHLATTATLFKHQLSKKLSTVLMDYLCCSLLHTELEGPPLCSSYHTHAHTHTLTDTHTLTHTPHTQTHTHTHTHRNTHTHTHTPHTETHTLTHTPHTETHSQTPYDMHATFFSAMFHM